ncbi:anthranilate synthase component I family protein [Motilimonas sp. 1_MG-2023]|uniref:anthranilate synthase component I family protein n=1 Tax=Motilimonas sp. 1_MG-2023 TaxID=3062672 RepID=UPI0026E20182|nr:anthranilate synthase component I family protein [Motilimonas sp. 1_MG-2023]MDO6525263.1 anthranilate synthase component I family protein [Motilimonas sp. 1_MG-2023]
MLKMDVERYARQLDVVDVFESVYKKYEYSFILQSSKVVPGFSRYSMTGASIGKHMSVLKSNVADGYTEEIRADGAKVFNQNIFELLKEKMTKFQSNFEHDALPFNSGYLGFFGYEALNLTAGVKCHTSPNDDVMMMMPTSFVVVDHLVGDSYFCTIHTDGMGVCDVMPAADEILSAVSSDLKAAQVERLQIDEVYRYLTENAKLNFGKQQYIDAIDTCKSYIKSGDSYEICLSNKVEFFNEIDTWQVYKLLSATSPAPHSSYIKTPDTRIASASPERFLSIDKCGLIEAKPIKGTMPRGATLEEDEAIKEALRNSQKDIAENLMIVDLMRNDISKCCHGATVAVPKLFDIESYSHYHQMVSTVQGMINIPPVDAFFHLFPGGSMTGAPKVRTLEIIDEIESSWRGVYSGAIGYFAFNGAADFSIVIRSLTENQGKCSIGVGGAITYLSDNQSEFEETLIKLTPLISAIKACVGEKSTVAA